MLEQGRKQYRGSAVERAHQLSIRSFVAGQLQAVLSGAVLRYTGSLWWTALSSVFFVLVFCVLVRPVLVLSKFQVGE